MGMSDAIIRTSLGMFFFLKRNKNKTGTTLLLTFCLGIDSCLVSLSLGNNLVTHLHKKIITFSLQLF